MILHILHWHALENDHPFKEGLDVLEENAVLKKKEIRLLFEPVKLSVKEFKQILEPTVAPSENCFQRFAEECGFDEFQSFLRRLIGIHLYHNFFDINYTFKTKYRWPYQRKRFRWKRIISSFSLPLRYIIKKSSQSTAR